MRESTIIRLIVGGVLLILVVWATFWFHNNFERATREITTGYSEEARNNPLLAAERFLTQLGIKSGSISASDLWHTMPQSRGVIIFSSYMQPRSKARQEQLRKWIESGGHLIIDADALQDADDKKEIKGDFLSELGARVSYPDDEDDDVNEQHIAIHFEGNKTPVHVTMSTYRHLVDSKGKAVAGVKLGKGYGLLQYELGDGYITVLSDNSFLFNREIGKEDNALALALLVGIHNENKVWLVHDVSMPSLPELAWRYAPYAVSAVVIASLLWLWSLGTRLGPLLPPAQTPRRDIGEHLAATAHYLWRLDRGNALLHANRQRIEQAWLNKHYMLRAMPLQERCEWIAARAGLSATVVERALYAQHNTESDFIEQSCYLQILRAAL